MKKVKLGDVCEIISGSTPKTEVKEYWGGEYKWITPAELSENSYIVYDTARHITKLGIQKTGLKPFPEGTVILSSRAPIGKTAIAGCEMYCNQGFKNLICSDEINNKYLYFFLSSKTVYLNSLGRGATFKELSKKIVENIELCLPPIEIQIRIAERFEQIEKLLSIKNAEIMEINELVKSRFTEMFGEPFLNPKGWEIAKIGDVVTEVRYGTSRPAAEGGKYPYLRMNNLTADGHLDLTDLKYIDIPDNEIEKCIVRKGDVLFNRTNSVELVGKTCVFDLDEEMVIAGYIIRVRLNEKVLSEFLSAYMNSAILKEHLRGMAKGAVNQANINAQDLQGIKIYLPPIELQQQFAEFVKQVEKAKSVIKDQLAELETLKKSLMQKYFR